MSLLMNWIIWTKYQNWCLFFCFKPQASEELQNKLHNGFNDFSRIILIFIGLNWFMIWKNSPKNLVLEKLKPILNLRMLFLVILLKRILFENQNFDVNVYFYYHQKRQSFLLFKNKTPIFMICSFRIGVWYDEQANCLFFVNTFVA